MSRPLAGGSARPAGPASQSVSLKLGDPSRVGEARRLAMTFGSRAGLGESEQGNLSIAVTEIASNTVNHAGGGELLLRTLEDGSFIPVGASRERRADVRVIAATNIDPVDAVED